MDEFSLLVQAKVNFCERLGRRRSTTLKDASRERWPLIWIAPDTDGQCLGSRFHGDLIGHHQIEDDAYFPQLSPAGTPHRQGGGKLKDAEHHALMDKFANGKSAALSAPNCARLRDAACRFLTGLTDFCRRSLRHLTDEEDLVLRVALKHRVG